MFCTCTSFLKTEHCGGGSFILHSSKHGTLYLFLSLFIQWPTTANNAMRIIQGEHKNTPWFQLVMKSKLTGIFLQNWWLQLHKLIQFHVISHTLNVPPLLLLGKHRCDNLDRTRLSAAYLVWPSWQLQWCIPAAHPRLRVVEVHGLCPSRTPKGPTLNLSLKARCTVTTLFYDIPACTSCVVVKWVPSCISLPSGSGREN